MMKMGSFIGANGKRVEYRASAGVVYEVLESTGLRISDLQDFSNLPLAMLPKIAFVMCGGKRMFLDVSNFVNTVFPPELWIKEDVVGPIIGDLLKSFGEGEGEKTNPQKPPENGSQ
jgi:hypothetical protein